MSHPSELISAYLDGELTAPETRRLLAHLSSCGRCIAEMEDTQRIRAAVRSLPVLDLPSGLVPEIDAEVVPFRRNRGVWVGAAAAVVVVLISVAALFAPAPPSVSAEDLTSRFGARVSLDPAFGPAKVVLPDWDVEVEDE